METGDILGDQVSYYRARAAEYDQWFLRQGRYDRGADHTAAWNREVEVVRGQLSVQAPLGETLELACGTGLWTSLLAQLSIRVTAIDASPEMLALNAERATESGQIEHINYARADLFSWMPQRTFDSVFFGFWLSHVPEDHFEWFWSLVMSCLRPGGRVFFVDSLPESSSKASEHPPDADGLSVRTLNDGQTFTIVKVFYDPHLLQARLASLGFTGAVTRTDRFFLHGCVARA